MAEYTVWDAFEDETERIETKRQEDVFNDALYRVDSRFGDYLRMARTAREFESRWSRTSNEILAELAELGVFPKPKVVREVKARFRPSFEEPSISATKNGWTYSPDLRVYATEGNSPFVCPCGTVLGRIGMNLCDGCGKVWNSWGITEAGRQKTLCREVNNDRSVILAKRRGK